MVFDALCMAAIADELRTQVLGGRVEKVYLPAPLAVALEIYSQRQRHTLLLSAHPQEARVHLVPERLGRGEEEVTPLLLLLRKYVRHGRLTAIEHPPLERTLALIITKVHDFDKAGRGEDGPVTRVSLVAEVIGRYSNIVLVDEEGTVLDSMKRVPSTINRYRVILPHHPYVPPPPQAKDDPHTITPATMGRLLRGRDDPLWQVLVQNLQGISPLAAREIAFRATGDAQARCDAAEPTAIVAALRELLKGLDTHTWNPTIAREEGAIVAFAPYALTHLAPGIEALPSISQAVAAYYTQDEGRGAYAGRKQALLQRLDEVRARLERKRESLLRGLIPAEEVERLRRQGELLLGYAHAIAPGTSEVTLDAGNGERERIILDPQRSAVENAQELFRRYAKARDAAREIPPLVAAVHEAIEEIDQVVLDVTLAQRGDELIEVEREVREVVGEERVGRVRPSRLPPRLYTSREGLVILVGRNAWQNQEITFSLASPRDLWLHARGVPGSHVIVRHGGGEIPETTIEDAARLAAWYSAARQEAAVDVSVAERRYVRPIPGRLGLVRVHHERVIRVTPGEPEGAQRA